MLENRATDVGGQEDVDVADGASRLLYLPHKHQADIFMTFAHVLTQCGFGENPRKAPPGDICSVMGQDAWFCTLWPIYRSCNEGGYKRNSNSENRC